MRYSRQEVLKEIPNDFQESIRDKKVVLVGCGGVGSILAQMLVRGGFLNISLVDCDFVDDSNLQRQFYYESDLGKPKVEALLGHLKKIDSRADIKSLFKMLDKNNIDDICKDSALIIDATDNFKTREVINTFCEKTGKDWIYIGAIRHEVMSCLFIGTEKYFNQIFGNEVREEGCAQEGVLCSTTSSAASVGYNSVIKYFLGRRDRKIIKMNLWDNKIFEGNIR